MTTLNGAISQVQADPTFAALPPDAQSQYLQEEVLPKADPTFKQLKPDEQQQYIQQEILPKLQPVQYPGPIQAAPPVQQSSPGVPAPFSAYLPKGLPGVEYAAENWASQLPGQITGAIQKEGQTFMDPHGSSVATAALSSLVQAPRDIAQSAADLTNAGLSAYMGVPYDPNNDAYTLPTVKDIPFIGNEMARSINEHPLTNFVTEGAAPVGELAGLLKRPTLKIPKIPSFPNPFKRKAPVVAPIPYKGRSVIPTRVLPKATQGEYGVGTRLLNGSPQEIAASAAQRMAAEVDRIAREGLAAQGSHGKNAFSLSLKQYTPEARAAIRDRMSAIKAEIRANERAQSKSQQPKRQQPAQGGKGQQQQKAPLNRQKEGQIDVQTPKEIQATLAQAHNKALEARVWYDAEGGKGRVSEDEKFGLAPERIEATKARIEALEAKIETAKASGRSTKTNDELLRQAKASLDTRSGIVDKGPQVVGGESLDKAYGTPRVVSIVEPPSSRLDGSITYKTLDESGIPKTRHVDHPESGSRTLRVELTGEAAKYELAENPETGKLQARHIGSGEFIKPGESKGSAYTSTLRGNAHALVAKIKAGEVLSNDDMMSVNDLKESDIKKLTPEERKKIGEQVDC